MTKRLRDNLRQMKQMDQFTADPIWIEQNKDKLLRQIANTTTEKPAKQPAAQTFAEIVYMLVPRQLTMAARPVMFFFVIMSVILGGYGVKAAAAKSLPGDTLYKLVKRPSEEIKLAFTKDEEKAEELLNLAKKRSDEIKELKNKNKKVAKEDVSEALESVTEHIEEAKEHVKKLPKEKVVDFAVELTKTKKDLEETLDTDLKDVVEEDATEEEAQPEAPDVSPEIDETTGDVVQDEDAVLQERLDETEDVLAEVEEIVLETVLSLDDEELADQTDKVKTLVEDKIDDVIKKQEESQRTAEEITDFVEQDAALLEEESTLPVEDVSSSSTEPIAVDATLPTSEDMEEVVEKVKETGDTVEKEVEELKQALTEEGDITDLKLALQEVAQLELETTQTKKEVKKVGEYVYEQKEKQIAEEKEAIETEDTNTEEPAVTDDTITASSTSETHFEATSSSDAVPE